MRVQPSARLIAVFSSLMNGEVETYSLVGHNDGLRVNPHTKRLWAWQNDDGNPNLVIIEPPRGHRLSTPSGLRRTAEGITR